MRRAELVEQLERLGSLPAPLPDRHRVQLLGEQLQREFVPSPSPTARSTRATARRQRRLVLAGGSALAAAAVVTAVLVLERSPRQQVELQAATGAVMLLPGGGTRDLQAGDHIPSGALIRTGPSGSVTVGGTRIGPDQIVLVEDESLTLLPAPDPAAEAGSTVPGAAATTAPAAAQTTAAEAHQQPSPGPTPTVVPPVEEAPPTAVPTPAATAPASAAIAAPDLPELALTVDRGPEGVRLSWTTVDSAAFGGYVVVRGLVETGQLDAIAVLNDRQITAFTDPSGPTGVDLLYRVVAVADDGRPIALSAAARVRLEETTPTVPPTDAPGSTDPPTSEPDASGDSVTATTASPDPTTSTSTTTSSTTSSTTTSSTTTSSTTTTSPSPAGTSTMGTPTTTGTAAAPTAPTAPTETTAPATTPSNPPATAAGRRPGEPPPPPMTTPTSPSPSPSP